MNKEIANIFRKKAELLRINGEKSAERINANEKAARYLESLTTNISDIYKEKGIKGLLVPKTIGPKKAKDIEEYITTGKIKDTEELDQETAIQQIIAYFFESKGLSLQELKENARKKNIIYSRFTKPAKQLLELAESIKEAKEAINKVALWANSRKLDYTIETVFKKWLELDRLKPKEIVKKPFYKGNPMVFSEAKKKGYVISKHGEWLLYAAKESEIEWKEIK